MRKKISVYRFNKSVSSIYLSRIRRTVNTRILSGIEAHFIQLTKKVGVKVFYSKQAAFSSFEKQKTANEARIGPMVISSKIARFGIEMNRNIEIKWGYLTQVVDTNLKRIRYWSTQMGSLERAMDDLGFKCCDLHEWNLGVIGRKLVCIDFGDEST